MNFLGEKEREIVKKAELSLTPMIDVVFLLLIFFMVGMKFKEFDRKLEADLPRESQQQPDQALQTEIWITIVNKSNDPRRPRCQYYVDRQPMKDAEHLKKTLQRLARVPRATEEDTIIIAPSDDALHGWVMVVLDYLNQCGFKNINFKQ